MADLGRPDLAIDQALTVLRRGEDDALAWAVLAYNQAAAKEPSERWATW